MDRIRLNRWTILKENDLVVLVNHHLGWQRLRSKVTPAPFSSSSPALLSKYGFLWLQKLKWQLSASQQTLAFQIVLHKPMGDITEGCPHFCHLKKDILSGQGQGGIQTFKWSFLIQTIQYYIPNCAFRSLGAWVASARKRRLPAGATVALFGPHLTGSVGVSDIGMDKPEFGEHARPWGRGAHLLSAFRQCSFLHLAHRVIKLLSLSSCLTHNYKQEIHLSLHGQHFCLYEDITHRKWISCTLGSPRSSRHGQWAEAVPVSGPGTSKRRRTSNKNRVDEKVQFGETPLTGGTGERTALLQLKVGSNGVCMCV